MNKLLSYLIAFFIALPFYTAGQEKNEELLTWSSSRKLNWTDYKASPDPESNAAASTTTYLSIEYKITTSSFGYKIKSWFSRTKSWGRHKSDYILSHEQGHFDIAEIYARKLHKLMSAYKFDRRSYQSELKKIYQDLLDEKEKMQNSYDGETNHSINKEKQAEWLKKIAKMLEEYKDWADY